MAFWSERSPLALLVSGLKPATVFSRSVYTRVLDARSTIWLVASRPERSALTVCNVTELASTVMDLPTNLHPVRSVAARRVPRRLE